MENRIIFHIDINCFFCRCEEIVNPKLQTLSFVVSERSRRGIICSSNLKAREFGIKAPMLVSEGLKKDPNLVVVDLHFDLYESKSRDFINCIKKFFTKEVETMSIDECYIDVTDILEQYHNNVDILAQHILNRLHKETGLYATIGISNNKFLAKMAGDTKPKNKIAKIFSWEVQEKIWNLPIKNLFGVGNKTITFFDKLKIYKVRDFLEYEDQLFLKKELKNKYTTLTNSCYGIGETKIKQESINSNSITRGRIYSFGLIDKSEILIGIDILFNSLYEELINKESLTRNLVLTFKLNNFESLSKNIKLDERTNEKNKLWNCFNNLFLSIWDGQEVKAITLTFNQLKKIDKNQIKINF
ncbi:MAG: Y-family DNA polymerase [Mycoplasma sp.]